MSDSGAASPRDARRIMANGRVGGYPKLPIQPLLDHIGGRQEDQAEVLGIDKRKMNRYKKTGITIYRADELAVKVLHMHPVEVWGFEAWLEAVVGAVLPTDDGVRVA